MNAVEPTNGGKVVFFLILSFGIFFIGGYALLIVLLTGGLKFYFPWLIIVIAGVLFILSHLFFRYVPPKLFKWSVIIWFVGCLLAVGIHEGVKAYHNSFETLDNHEVDLYEYMPFAPNSKLAQLEGSTTWKLEEDVPIIDGATAFYPLYAAFAEAVYPKGEYDVYESEVMANTTPYAYENLIEGAVDMIFVFGPSENQLKYAEEKGVTLYLTPIGKEAFVFFVNASNPIHGLSLSDIRSIYAGEQKNWQAFGGPNERIRAFQRPADSGSQTALEKLMGDTRIMDAPKEDVVMGMGGIIEETASYRNYKNAIGYSFRYFSTEMVQQKSIKHVEIDGVPPTEESVQDGSYPLTYEFYAVTTTKDDPTLNAFIDWILSDQGQELVRKTGYVPIR